MARKLLLTSALLPILLLSCSVPIISQYEPDAALYRPTMNEVWQLLKDADCDEITDDFACLYRAEKLNNEAIKKNIWCWVVLIDTQDNHSHRGHVLCAFDTLDEGVVFIEPLYGIVVTCEVGFDYSRNFADGMFPRFIIERMAIIH